MDLEDKIKKEVEKTLQADDNLETIKGNPFLFTRIESELIRKTSYHKLKLNKKVALKPALLLLIILINFITCWYFVNKNVNDFKREYLIKSLNQDYDIN